MKLPGFPFSLMSGVEQKLRDPTRPRDGEGMSEEEGEGRGVRWGVVGRYRGGREEGEGEGAETWRKSSRIKSNDSSVVS